MRRTIKTGYMIRDEDGNFSGYPSDFYEDYGEIFFDRVHAKDVYEEMKQFDDKLKLVTVVMCLIEDSD